jgi:hypothetical protein
MGQRLKAQRISTRSEVKEESSKMARFQELNGSELEYPLAYFKSLEFVIISNTAMP